MLVQQFFVNGWLMLRMSWEAQRPAPSLTHAEMFKFTSIQPSDGVEDHAHSRDHLHADFISGHLDLAEKTGAKIYAPKSGKCQFEHVTLSEGDRFEIEDMEIKVFETPGHTPEHLSYVVHGSFPGEDPVAVFTGDTLFVGMWDGRIFSGNRQGIGLETLRQPQPETGSPSRFLRGLSWPRGWISLRKVALSQSERVRLAMRRNTTTLSG